MKLNSATQGEDVRSRQGRVEHRTDGGWRCEGHMTAITSVNVLLYNRIGTLRSIYHK